MIVYHRIKAIDALQVTFKYLAIQLKVMKRVPVLQSNKWNMRKNNVES